MRLPTCEAAGASLSDLLAIALSAISSVFAVLLAISGIVF